MLRGAGIRLTQQPQTVIAAYMQSHDRPSAQDVRARQVGGQRWLFCDRLPRAISADASIVHPVAVDDGPARFKMAPKTEHSHLVDIDSDEVLELASYEDKYLARR
ncbi:MAG: Fur family ferric uptake transcriptional regulator [Yoonia sp.]|jgi:Fur family ferric uptake transcriptional regulator